MQAETSVAHFQMFPNRIHSACLHCNKPSLTRSLYTATKTPANSGKQPPDSPRGVTLATKCLNVFVK